MSDSETKRPSMPYFPLFCKDFDASTASWSCTSVGAYIRLLNYSWENDGLPADEKRLRRIIRVDADEWEEVWEDVSPKFEEGEDGRLRNRRQEEQRAESLSKYHQRVEAGKRSAERRKKNQAEKQREGNERSNDRSSARNNDRSNERCNGRGNEPPNEQGNGKATNQNQNQNQNISTPSYEVVDIPTPAGVERVGGGWVVTNDWSPDEETRAAARIAGARQAVIDDPDTLQLFRLKYREAPQRDAAFSKRFVHWCVNETRNPPRSVSRGTNWESLEEWANGS